MHLIHLVREVFRRKLSGQRMVALLCVAMVSCTPLALALGLDQDDQAKAVEVLNAALMAHGGLAAVSRITDTTSLGQVRIYRPDGTYEQHAYTFKTRAFDQLRTEVDGTELYISNGRAGWVLRMGKKERLPTHEVVNNLVRLNPVLGLLGAYQRNRFQLAYKGVVSRESRQFHHITASFPDPDPRRKIDREFEILIDAATSLIFSVSYSHLSIRGVNPKAQHEYRYSDYRTAQGLVVPFRVEKFLYGSKRDEVLLASFQMASHGDIFGEP